MCCVNDPEIIRSEAVAMQDLGSTSAGFNSKYSCNSYS